MKNFNNLSIEMIEKRLLKKRHFKWTRFFLNEDRIEFDTQSTNEKKWGFEMLQREREREKRKKTQNSIWDQCEGKRGTHRLCPCVASKNDHHHFAKLLATIKVSSLETSGQVQLLFSSFSLVRSHLRHWFWLLRLKSFPGTTVCVCKCVRVRAADENK